MRPIKFRAWEPDEEAKGGGTMWDVRELTWDAGGIADAYLGLHSAERDSFFLMQFTGLHDKNGKEIYEGDILEFNKQEESRNFVVWLPGGCWGLESEFKDHPLGVAAKMAEVIGNIYEQPNLIGVSE